MQKNGRGFKWTPEEDEVIRRVFKTGGSLGVQAELPHRSLKSIQTHACNIGVKGTKICESMKPVSRMTFTRNLLDDIFAPMPNMSGTLREIDAEDIPQSLGGLGNKPVFGIQSGMGMF